MTLKLWEDMGMLNKIVHDKDDWDLSRCFKVKNWCFWTVSSWSHYKSSHLFHPQSQLPKNVSSNFPMFKPATISLKETANVPISSLPLDIMWKNNENLYNYITQSNRIYNIQKRLNYNVGKKPRKVAKICIFMYTPIRLYHD